MTWSRHLSGVWGTLKKTSPQVCLGESRIPTIGVGPKWTRTPCEELQIRTLAKNQPRGPHDLAMTPRSGTALLSDPVAIRRQFPLLARMGLHYLDSAATAQMPEPVIAALQGFSVSLRANVYGGVYKLAQEALAAYEAARADVARFLGAASPQEVVFTYGTTSSLNLLAQSFGERLREGDEMVLSILEHHSNILPWRALARRRRVNIRVLPMTADGRLYLAQLRELVTSRCRIIALTHCSNVTGALTDTAPVVAAARAVGAAVVLDGAQRAPHGPLDVRKLGIDFYASRATNLRSHRDRRPLGPRRNLGEYAALHGGRTDDPARVPRLCGVRRPAAPVRGRHSADWGGRRARGGDPLDGTARLGRCRRA